MAKIDRRDFIKVGVAGSSLLTLKRYCDNSLQAEELTLGGTSVSRTTGRDRKAVRSTCLNCYARCGLLGFMEYGRLVKLEGNPDHPNSRGRLCAKGQAGVNLVYDPDRMIYPMKRAGKRGGGKWKRISWEEAYSTIAEKLKTIHNSGHPEEFVIQSERDITTQNFVTRFMHAFGSPNALVHADLGWTNKKLAQLMTWGESIDINDVAYTQYMLNFGSNPYEAHILRTSFAQRIAEGRALRLFEGRVHSPAKIVTFDVRVSQTAGKSDEWHPIKPGTDGIVALAMANEIMQANLYNKEFLEKWTNYPVDKLKNYLSQYTSEIAEKESGVSAADIKRIAYEFAETKPATTISTGGVTKHKNGTYNERCVFLLNVITGNIDTKGGYCMPRMFELKDLDPVPQVPSIKSELLRPSNFPLLPHEAFYQVLPMVEAGREKVSLYMTYNYNPVYSNPCSLAIRDILKNEKIIPFYVAIDSSFTESTVLADIILPEATYLERWELETPPSLSFIPFVSLRQPVVKPLGESASHTDIMIELAKRVGDGMENYFNFASTKEYIKAVVSKIDKLKDAGGFEHLREKGIWFDPDAQPEYKQYEKKGLKTPSGKIEIYSKQMEAKGFNPLPVYVPIEEHSRMKNNEFHLVTFQWNVHTHGRTANCMWLSEIVHQNRLWINYETAKRLGIGKDDEVRVDSRIGSIKTKVWITNGIHPKVVALSDSCGHWAFGRIARAKKFESEEPDTEFLWWSEEGNGVHPNLIIPIVSDPVGGSQAWMDTVVRITKV